MKQLQILKHAGNYKKVIRIFCKKVSPCRHSFQVYQHYVTKSKNICEHNINTHMCGCVRLPFWKTHANQIRHKKHWSQVPNNKKHRQTWDMGTTKNGEKKQVPEHLKVGAPKSANNNQKWTISRYTKKVQIKHLIKSRNSKYLTNERRPFYTKAFGIRSREKNERNSGSRNSGTTPHSQKK
jgi:hypothetical protein